MLTAAHPAAVAFAIEADTLLHRIRMLRGVLDLAPIREWANAQAQADTEHNALHYLEQAYRAVLDDGPLPWLPAPSGLTPAVTRNESP